MTREQATRVCFEELEKHNLKDWHVRLTTNATIGFLALCSYKDKCIILNAHHIDIHSDPDVMNTIRHEVAHALTPKHYHDETWAEKAREIGCDNVQPCSHLSFTPEIIDAIRSGAEVQVSYEEEIIRRPKYQVTRLQDKCEHCGKVAKTKSETLVTNPSDTEPDKKFIFLECGHMIIKNIPKGTPFHKLVSDEDNDEEIKGCNHNWNKNQCSNCGAFRPYQFQLDGMNFIEQALATNKGAAVFDEMGLGKTIQACGYIKYHPESWPVLYIVKSGIKYQWLQAILTWMGPMFAGQVLTSSKDYVIPGLRTYIISYDLLIPKVRKSKTGKLIQQGFDISKLLGKFKTIVLDECQQIKNPDSSRTQQVRKLAKDCNVIALSGTPWKNRGSEFYSVLNMMAPLKFPSYQGYLDKWVSYYWDGEYRKEGGINNPKAFKEYIKDIAIRRERTEVMSELPLVRRMKLPVELTELEQDQYDEEEGKFVAWYNEQVINGEEPSGINILARMSRMRHLTGLAKIPATETFIEEFIEDTDRKIVVFVHHQDVGQILWENCKRKYGNEIPVMQLTGSMNGIDRFDVQERFNKSSRAILIASTLAAGEGLNLQTCADCIMHERQWNPANEEQAEGRFIRIGQTAESVGATYVQGSGTIDSHFDGIVERKRGYFHAGMNKGEAPKWNEGDIAKELAKKVIEAFNKKRKKVA